MAQRNLISSRRRWLLACASGLLLTGSFPNIDAGWLAWVALVPLLAAVKRLGWQKAFGVGFVTGLVHYLTLIYWIAYTMRTFGHLPWPVCVSILVLLSAYLALFIGAFAALVRWLACGPAAALLVWPFLWVSLEYVRSFLLSGFPWELMGHSQYRALHLIQISDILGVYGISYLILFANSAVFLILLSFSKSDWNGAGVSRRLAVGAGLSGLLLMGFAWYYGEQRMAETDHLSANASSLRVAVVQGNIEQALKWNPTFQQATIEKYLSLSQGIMDQHPELTVWPETALPFYFQYDAVPTAKVIDGIRRMNGFFLVGSPSFIRDGDRLALYNSAFLIDPRGVVQGKYNKAHLVPFGEYVPLQRWLPFLGKLVAQVGDFARGKTGDTIAWQNGRMGVLICYEAIFAYIARSMVANGADLLVNITNDAWYGRSSAPYQHFSMAVFRAVENRRALVRSANTGISGYIDPTGRISDETALFTEAARVHAVPLMTGLSFYTRFGDVFAALCLAVSGTAVGGRLWEFVRNRKK